MSEPRSWIARIEAELARELGQPVEASAGGDAPEEARCQIDVLELPAARLVLAADREDLARLLTEGRVIEAGQADAETVRELWTGILGSVAARMEGALGSPPAAFPAHPCTLRLGEAKVRLALDAEEKKGIASAAGQGGQETAHPEKAASRRAADERPAEPGRYDLLLEVALETTVRFGCRMMELRDLLELGPGDVVELDRQVTDPVDPIVGDKIVARGEVVLVDGNFGLRVTEVAEPVSRLESIR